MKGSKKCKIWHFFCPPKCISGNGRIWTNPDFSESLSAATRNATKIEAINPFFVFSQGSKNGQKFKKNIFFQNMNFHISNESSWRAHSKNANFFDQKLILAEILAMKGSKKCKIWHFFCPPKCISGNGRIWTNPDFSESPFVATVNGTKIEAIYPFFAFSQGSKNGQKFQKKYFFQKLNFHIPFESSWRAESKNGKIFEKILLLDVLQPVEGSKSGIFDIFFAPQYLYQKMVRFGQTQIFLKASLQLQRTL